LKKIRVIGDLHQKYNQYLKIVADSEYSICVGDIGFDYEPIKHLDDEKVKWLFGNHDNYDKCFAYPHGLGDYGVDELNSIPFYYVRGAFSIDKEWRQRHYQLTGQKSWWEKEELNLEQMYGCLDYYCSVKPNFIITHEAPRSVVKHITNSSILREFGFDPKTFTTNTSELLDKMFLEHQPKLWILGHFHTRKDFTINGTRFIVLPELGFCDVDQDLNVTRLYTN
jgi:predicted phosphodiesterase